MKDFKIIGAGALPKISIITPSYNQGNYLEETILSIISQNYGNYELVIIDAGSTDDTLKIIDKYKEWITYWISEPDRGQSHAIQKGLAKVTGDIVNWINSDDIVAPGAFHRIAKEFDLTRYDVICGKCDYFINSLDKLDLRGMRMGIFSTIGDTIVQHKINQPSTFFKASVLKNLSIDEDFRYTMDVDLWYRYLLAEGQSRILISDGLFTYFRLHESSKSVAESGSFNGEVWKVHYNIFKSIQQDQVLLDFSSHFISDFSKFIPKNYDIKVPVHELHPFVRYVAWLALIYYNEHRNFKAARKCLRIYLRSGQVLNKAVIKQIIKHYLLPKYFLG